MPDPIKKIIIHIEDEFTDWHSLIIGIEAEILNGLENDDDFNSFEIMLPENRKESPACTKLEWTKHGQPYELMWAGNKSANLENALLKDPFFADIKPENMFFIIDCLRPNPNGEGQIVSIDESFADIDKYILDTYKQVRIFTAYKATLLQGEWDITLPLKPYDIEAKQMSISELEGLFINKERNQHGSRSPSGLIFTKAGSNTQISTETLEDVLMNFIYE